MLVLILLIENIKFCDKKGRPVALDDCGVALDDVREAYRIICDLVC